MAAEKKISKTFAECLSLLPRHIGDDAILVNDESDRFFCDSNLHTHFTHYVLAGVFCGDAS